MLNMLILRLVLLTMSLVNFLLTWLLLVFTEWAKQSIGEPFPRFFHCSKDIVYIMTGIALIASLMLIFPYMVKLVHMIVSFKLPPNKTRPQYAYVDVLLLIIFLVSHIAIISILCSVVMANSRYSVNGLLMNSWEENATDIGSENGSSVLVQGILTTEQAEKKIPNIEGKSRSK